MVNYKKQQAKKQREAKVQQKQQLPTVTTESLKKMTFQPCPDGTVNLQFTPIDTWFFRESRPHDAAGASELSSLFPPPVKTLLGAVRTFWGDSLGVDWKKFNAGDGFAHTQTGLNLIEAIGNGENLGKLSINGAWVCKNGERLYPAPCYLMQKADALIRLQIGDVVECDLGKVRLPELPKDNVGYKGLEQTWITREGWQTLLQGETPVKEELIQAKDLFGNEPRLGIARDNSTRSVIEGRLYQTQHLRLENDVTIELDVKGLNEVLAEKLPVETKHEILRLGGEGRMAMLEKKSHYPPLPTLIIDKQPLKKIIIHFITPAYFNGQMFPENFDKHEIDGQTVWQGKLLDIELIIEAAVIGKAHREGGWDMQKHEPRSVKSYIPAGSAWFCRVVTEISNEDLLEKLHGQSIGAEIEWGRGQILIGLWNDTKTQGK
ncbi:MAG: type III-B CRISPR module-associated Cmr3 family protein [Methylococcales bacterium]